jgi:hypothetical protein
MVFSYFIEFFLLISDSEIGCKFRKMLFSVMIAYVLCAIIYISVYMNSVPRPPLNDFDRRMIYSTLLHLFYVYYLKKTITISCKK